MKPFSSLSQALSKEERNYCVTRRELLAVVHFVNHYRYYLQGKPFTVRTDHASLKWLLNQKEPRDQLARWIQQLDMYQPITVDHRPGKQHGNADGMSRRGTGKCFRGGHCLCQETPEIKSQEGGEHTGGGETGKALAGSPLMREGNEEDWTTPPPGEAEDHPPMEPTISLANQETLDTQGPVLVSALHENEGQGEDLVTTGKGQVEQVETEPLKEPQGLQIGFTLRDFQEQQEIDPEVKVVKAWRESRDQCPSKEEQGPHSKDVKYWCGRWQQLEIKDGLLQYRWEPEDPKGLVRYRIITPRSLRPTILTALHDLKAAGHMGINRTQDRAKKCAYIWPGMCGDVQRWIRCCQLCQQRKGPKHKKRAQLVTYQSGAPWERIAMDVAGPFPTTDKGNKYILVVQDYFTKWVEVHPMPDQTAETVATILVDNIIARFGCPRELHSDQGSNFESRVMKEVNRLLGVKKTRTTPYHPRGDGMVERHNRTLENMLSLWTNERQTDWDQHIPLLSMAYRSSPHKSTGETPNLLMLGREVTLPVDLILEAPPEEDGEEPPNLSGYATELLEKMHVINEAAQKVMTQQMVSQKRHYDQNVRLTDYKVGDVVWLYHLVVKKGTTHKFRRKWTGPYIIRTKLSDVVYRIQASPRSKPQIIHADRIKLCYGTTAAELGFPNQGELSPSAEATSEPSPEGPVPAPEGTVGGSRKAWQKTPQGHQPAEEGDQIEAKIPPSSALPQPPRRKGKKHPRRRPPAKKEEPVAPHTPVPLSPIQTRTGRTIRPPQRFGW